MEARWYGTLYRHCEGLFSGVFLPSHDQSHHARVWSYARSLLLHLEKTRIRISPALAEELIIASFFHDTGLVRTSSERHGRESRRFCEEFFSRTGEGFPLHPRKSVPAILDAVEHHDDKSFRKISSLRKPGRTWADNPGTGPLDPAVERTLDPAVERPGDPPGLLSLLSCADDLDAFGNIGIYRYAEIYLMRGVEPEHLPRKVCENVKNRFDNIRSTFAFMGDFLKLQESRFRKTYEFYLRLDRAFTNHDGRPSWETGLIALISEGIRDRRNLLQAGREGSGSGFDEKVGNWFRALDAELSSPA